MHKLLLKQKIVDALADRITKYNLKHQIDQHTNIPALHNIIGGNFADFCTTVTALSMDEYLTLVSIHEIYITEKGISAAANNSFKHQNIKQIIEYCRELSTFIVAVCTVVTLWIFIAQNNRESTQIKLLELKLQQIEQQGKAIEMQQQKVLRHLKKDSTYKD